MDFIDHLRMLASRVANTRDLVQAEDAIKSAMAMPSSRSWTATPGPPGCRACSFTSSHNVDRRSGGIETMHGRSSRGQPHSSIGSSNQK